MYYVYVLWSEKLQCRYTGYTGDIKNRIMEHNAGEDDFTSKGCPWKLVYLEMFISKKDAMAEEKFLKSGKGRDRLKYLLKNTFGRVA